VVAIDHLANEFFKRKQPGAALALYRQALEIKPKHWLTHFAIGITLYELGDNQQATKELEDGIRVAPENSEQYFFLGLSQLGLSNYARAEQEFRQAQRRNPRRPGLNHALATALLKQGKIEEAKEALRAEVSLTQDRGAAEELEKLQRQ
jgi:Flp pilus assembly protein TadD